MAEFRVRETHSNTHVTFIPAKNILEARDKFARMKGYEDWGDMVVSYKHSPNGLKKPPFSIEKVNG